MTERRIAITSEPVPIAERWAIEDQHDEEEVVIIRNGRRIPLKDLPPDRSAPDDEPRRANQ